MSVGNALPATCNLGQLFYNTAAAAGANVYSCTSPNSWTVVGGYTLPPAGATTLGGVMVGNNSGLLLSNGALSANTGTTAGTVAAGNDSRIANALQPTSLIPAANITGLARSATTDATNASNITSGTLAAGRLPTPSATTLGGVESITPTAHQWISSISTSGIPASTQPSFADLSGAATSVQLPTSIVFNNQVNTYSNQPAPAVPATGNLSCWTDSTNKNWECKNDAGTILNSIIASSAGANQFATGINTSGAISYAQPSFGNLSGAITTSQLGGSVGGDLNGTLPNPTVAMIHGTSVPTNSSADQALVTTQPATASWTSIPSCLDTAGQHLNYNTATHTFSCGSTSSGGGSGGGGIGGSGSANSLPLFTGTTTLGNSSLTQNPSTGALTATQDLLCDSRRPCVDVVALGADPTGATASDTAFANAHNLFNGTSGGTITMCGTFKLTKPWIITNPALHITSNCGTSGWASTSPVQLGGAVLESTATTNIPNQTAGPVLVADSNGGTLSGTYYIETTLVNGNGETLPSPSTPVTVSGGNDSIDVDYPQYQSGGFAFNIYCSTDNTNFYKVPAADFLHNGTNTGPPWLVGIGTSANPVVMTCPSSGTTPPTSNTATNGVTLVQIGTSSTVVSAGPVFDGITFTDPNHVLAGGVVEVQANRSEFNHCLWSGFNELGASGINNGFGPVGAAGQALYEGGGIAVAFLSSGNSTGAASNHNAINDPEFYNNTLSILNTASDSSVEGGDINYGNGVGIDYAGGNIRVFNIHFSANGGATNNSRSMVWRGTSANSGYGGIADVKIEGLQTGNGVGVQLMQRHESKISMICAYTGGAANPCVLLDSASTGNRLDLVGQGTQCLFSDGSTCLTDPSSGNYISYCENGGSCGLMIKGVAH